MRPRRAIAPGSDGAGLVRRLYRRSPIRRLVKVEWDHRGLRSHDVVLASYPRSGSVWLRFLLVDMISGGASFKLIQRQAPYVGGHRAAPALLPNGGRLIKSHEPYLPRYRRAIHLVRDPRDVALSYFRFMQRIGRLRVRPGDDLDASLDRFLGAFLAGRSDAHGTWLSHLLSWVEASQSGQAAILRLRYEDLRADTAHELLRIADWLGWSISLAESRATAERCSIERMRESEAFELATNGALFKPQARASGVPLINEGRVGGWREILNHDQQRRFLAMADGLRLMGYPLD